ncbi:MAG: hypothetical protein KAR40_07940 [Candidatus Sabulitectum sp.]|nr:hypothetical protein [Candidatus Sabulitectum sp.]
MKDGVQSTTSQNTGSDDVLAKIGDAIDIPGYEDDTPPTPDPDADPDVDPDADPDDVDPDDVDPDADPDDVDPDDVDPDADPDDVDPDADPDDVDPDDDGVDVGADQIAQLLGVEEGSLIVEEDGSVAFQTKVDGETGKVNLTNLIKSHQTEAHVTRKSQALADERRDFDGERAQATEVIKARIGEVAAVSQILEQQLTSAYSSINWPQLRADNPAEWSAKQQEFKGLVDGLNAAKQKAGLVLQEQAQELQAKADVERNQRYIQTAENLKTAIPTWNDPKVAEKEFGELSKFLSDTYGFEGTDIGAVEDHRLFMLARDAMNHRVSQKVAKSVKHKIKKLPRITRPGSGKKTGAKTAAARDQQKKMIRLKKTGTAKDLASVLADRISV